MYIKFLFVLYGALFLISDPGSGGPATKTFTTTVGTVATLRSTLATNAHIHAMTDKLSDKQYTYLALGDSYTIGTSVSIYETYPYQTVQLLRKSGHAVCAPEIVARNGWTTGELEQGIDATHFLTAYDIVSLLIGVNNEYRGRSAHEYEKEFEMLLKKAIHFAGGRPERVFVLSIPDWSVTPFGQNGLPDAMGRDQQKVAAEIDAFNAINKAISDRYKVNYINITPHTKIAGTDPSCLASDFLHPSGKEYGFWAEALVDEIGTKLDR